MPQETYPFIHQTVLHEVLTDPELCSGPQKAKAQKILKGLGFKDSDFERSIRELYGGWQMRVAIAKLLFEEPDLLMLDEPTNHLSVRERAHVNELAVQLKQQGLLVIYITHDIFQIHRIADRIVIMENGRKVTDVPRDAMSAEALEGIIRDGGRAPTKGPKVA